MKTPSSGLNTQLTAQGARPGYLCKIAMTNGVALYLTGLDDGFLFASQTWSPADLIITGITWSPGSVGTPKLTLGDASNVYWAYATSGVFQDATVNVWLCYAGASNQAEPVFRGFIGNPRRGDPRNGDMTIQCDLLSDGDLKSSPRRRVQNVIPPQFLLAAGTKIPIGSDIWVLERQ